MRYARILAAVAGTPWAIREEKGEAIVRFLSFAARGGRNDPADIEAIIGRPIRSFDDEETGAERRARLQAEEERATADRGGIAILSVAGILSPRLSAEMDISSGGGTSAEGFTRRLRAAMNDARVAGIIIDVDSPGGNVMGIAEAATELYATRGASKPVVAIANHDACSAAYHLASAAPELVATPSADVGSIGVYTYHEDISKALADEGVAVTLVKAGPNKAETFPAFPLTEDARAFMQSRVDDYYRRFVGDVAKARGVQAGEVEKRFGGGRAVGAEAALAAGMIDRIATLDQEIERMASRISKPTGKRSAVADMRRRVAMW